MKQNWQEYPCPGCKAPLLLPHPPILACPDCRAGYYEDLAAALDPSWDKSKTHDFVDAWAILKKLWCFPPSKDGDGTRDIKTTVSVNTHKGGYVAGTWIDEIYVPVLTQTTLW